MTRIRNHSFRSGKRLILLAFMPLATGCQEQPESLQLADLTPGESLIVERMVILERAKDVALIDRDTGEALLDSLSGAWGDSSLAKTQAGAPVEPGRAEAFGVLLRRVMAAEQESLLTTPGSARLHSPLPDLSGVADPADRADPVAPSDQSPSRRPIPE
jgi:hypothetical protein